MNKLEFPWPQYPEPGMHTTVLSGIEWIRMPMPFALDHVNCWFLHDGSAGSKSGNADANNGMLIDTGVQTKQNLELWDAHTEQLGWPAKLLVTHFHPDHSGLAGLFSEHGAQVFSTKIEWDIVERLHAVSDEDYCAIYRDWYLANGIEQSYIDILPKIGNGYKLKTVPPPAKCEYLSAGDTLELEGRTYSVLTGQGHSPDMVMLYCEAENFLIAADQVLPAITPNVSIMPQLADPNPLLSFMQCLTSLRELPEETLVLPSHGLPFTGLHERLDYLLDHHQKRLGEIEQALSTEHTAAQLFSLLFKRKLDNQQVSFALGETLAHLKYLQAESRVSCENRDGVDVYWSLS